MTRATSILQPFIKYSDASYGKRDGSTKQPVLVISHQTSSHLAFHPTISIEASLCLARKKSALSCNHQSLTYLLLYTCFILLRYALFRILWIRRTFIRCWSGIALFSYPLPFPVLSYTAILFIEQSILSANASDADWHVIIVCCSDPNLGFGMGFAQRGIPKMGWDFGPFRVHWSAIHTQNDIPIGDRDNPILIS